MFNTKKNEYTKDEVMVCKYCGDGPLELTSDWVMLSWIHQKCDSENNISYSGTFYCK